LSFTFHLSTDIIQLARHSEMLHVSFWGVSEMSSLGEAAEAEKAKAIVSN